ncbi:GTP-binding protein [Bradyrhizobium sp.]|uniref:CobW family GTP-binding protein n=1 Tax=Bradyrhizobium sp. TaxID=376 RepID=UPI00260CFDD0|nr:GTP-binding protein [Bradyrhizobium sp.]
MPDAGRLRPVTVLTGFLGSGKTTTLARLLKTSEFAGTVAIINEFGEIGLDHLLIETSEERFALLDNGCVCCTVRDDLVETLLRLIARADAGELPDFRRVVVETTGLADPAPILHALMAEERLARCYRIDGVLATVDAVNGLATLNAHREAVKQVAVADRLLLTKTDIAGEGAQTPLLSRLATLNPTALVIHSREGDAPASALTGLELDAAHAGPGEIVGWFERAARAAEQPHFRAEAHIESCRNPDCADPRHGLQHDKDISTFSIIIDRPVAWGAFKQWLEYLALLKGEDLLRFKGLVHVAERPDTPIVVHGVQHVFHPPCELAAWPSADRRTRLVFITRGIRRATIEDTLSKFAAIDLARMRRPAA